LHAVKNSKTFPTFPLNICSLATSMFDPVLGLVTVVAASSPIPPVISA